MLNYFIKLDPLDPQKAGPFTKRKWLGGGPLTQLVVK